MALTTVRPQGMGFNTGRRNLIINGAMQVNQRGDSTGVTSGNYHGPDRYRWHSAHDDTVSISQDTSAPDGFVNSYKVAVTVADTSLSSGNTRIEQRIEGQNLRHLKYGTSSAESVTLSFHVKSNKTGTYVASIYEETGANVISKTYTISSADTWEAKSITFPGLTTASISATTGTGLRIWWGLAAASDNQGGSNDVWTTGETNWFEGQTVNILDSTSNTFFLTGCQLELGENASDFEHRSFGEELALCQRYFQHWNLGGTYQSGGGFPAMLYSTDLTFGTIPFFCEMRAAPTGSMSAANTWQFINASDTPNSVNSVSIYSTSKVSASFQCDPSTSGSTPVVGNTGGGILWPGNTNSNDATVSMDAEL
jgi:hypothetical protein